MAQLYLTRRNLLTLLNKLDKKEGVALLIKNDTQHPKYPCSERIRIVALEDAEYYTDREPGKVSDAPE